MPTTEVIVRHDKEELARVQCEPGVYIIGRSKEASIHVPTPLISRLHARLTIEDGQVLIEDLDSSNGTFVDEERITEPTPLRLGHFVRLGDVRVEIVWPKTVIEPEPPAEPAPSPIEQLLPVELRQQQRYAIGQQVARGGMGAILQAEQATMKRRVAMKVMLDTCDADDVMRFVEEAQITGQLEHPGIVPIYELGLDERGQLFYTMKFVRGITLKKVLELIATGVPETVKKFPLPTLLTIFQKTCDAVAFAHSKGVIHRDLKPENIMLGDFGEVLIMDWGLAKVLGSVSRVSTKALRSPVSHSFTGGSSHTMAGTVLGTPHYMAPEQARGEVDTLDVRADIYALGGILFEILHLRTPFSGTDPWEIVDRVKRGEIEWAAATISTHTATPQKKKSPPPDSLLAICRKALALDREQRYARVDQLQEDIAAYQNGFATSAEKASWPKRAALAFKRNKTVSIAAALVVFAVGFFGTHAVLQGRRAAVALAALQRNAPSLLQLAETEATYQRFDSALQKVDAALSIDPTLHTAYWRRTWILVGLERWSDAAEALRLAKRKDPARARLASIADALDQLARMPDNAARFASPAMSAVMDVLSKVGASGERLHFAVAANADAPQRQAMVQQRIDEWRGKGRQKVEFTGPLKLITLKFTGATIDSLEPLRGLPIQVLTFTGRGITSLEPLRGMPLQELECGGTSVTDLSPLTGMPLRRILLSNTRVTDLSPLRGAPLETFDAYGLQAVDVQPLAGMPLKYINWGNCPTSDLSPLKGAPLETLLLYNGQIADFSFLAGAPLTRLEINGNRALSNLHQLAGLPIKELNLENCPSLKDLRPLLALPALERLRVSAKRSEIAVLRPHPTLQFIAIGNGSYRAAADYWAESESVLPTVTGIERRTLRGLDLAESETVTSIAFARGLPIELLDLRRTKVTDLSPIAGMQTLRVVRIAGCPIVDFSPLKGLPLTELRVGGTSFDDLSMLEGMPLGLLTIDNTKVFDVAPLARITSLRMLCIPMGAKNIEALRKLPQLTHLSYRFNTDRDAPEQTVAEFWAEYDAEQKKAK